MILKTPQSLKEEHDELHDLLARAIKAGGATGEAAVAVEKALHPHFLKEEEYALPQLGLLPVLAEGKILPEMEAAASAVALTNRLKSDLSHMLSEHQQIIVTLEALEQAANLEENEMAVHFAEKLRLHARTEEEVLYPAAILVGEYLKLNLNLNPNLNLTPDFNPNLNPELKPNLSSDLTLNPDLNPDLDINPDLDLNPDEKQQLQNSTR